MHPFLSSADTFFSNQLFQKIFQEYYQNVSFDPGQGRTEQGSSYMYQRTMLVEKELSIHLFVSETIVRRVSSRLRRNADSSDSFSFPEEMTFTLTLEEVEVQLHLGLNQRQNDHVPVKLYNNGLFTLFNDTSPRVSVT